MEDIKHVLGRQDLPPGKKMTAYERVQFQCDSYNNSVGNLNEKDGYNCDICKNKSYVAEVRQGANGLFYDTLRPCKCYKTRESIRRMKRSGLKDIISDCTFDKYKATEGWQKILKQKAIEFVQDEHKQMFFIGGQSGAGKTHICTAICRELIYKGYDVHYMLWREDVPKIKAIANDAVAYEEAVRKLKTIKVLYIDDLFKMGRVAGQTVSPTVADINFAFEVINHRYNNKELITIISSELMLQDIIEIDEAIGGRISERSLPAGYCMNINKDSTKNYRTKGILTL